MSFLKEFWAFLRARKKFWLAPILIVMLLVRPQGIFGARERVG